MPQRLSFQLYSARNFPPLEEALRLLAATGYRAVEGFGGVYDDPARLKAALAASGLVMPTGHFSLEMLEGEPERVRAIASAAGMHTLYCPWLAPEQRPKTAAGWTRFGKRLARIGAWARGEGFQFGWHNHDFEFARLPDGQRPIALILAAAPLIDWECDVAWIVRAKTQPLTWIKAYAQRISAVHVKDIAARGEAADEDGWADAGHGTMDWRRLMAALRRTRATHFVMEHDNPSDLARFASRSFAAIARL